MATKRESVEYRTAVDWIAMNDAPADKLPEKELAGQLTVCLVADVFGKDKAQVAREVYKSRIAYWGE